MDTIFYIGIMLLAGLLLGRLAKLVGFPNVTGYLIAGLLFGPSVTGLLDAQLVKDTSELVSGIALGFIALFIGAEFKLSFIREMGMAAIIVAVFESAFAAIFVTAALVALGTDFSLALILGAIAAATAPAVTIMIIKQYNANGPLTRMLLSVVALDDATALIMYSIAVAIVKSMAGSSDILMSIAQPFIEMGLSAVMGTAAAFLLLIPLRFFKKPSNRMCAIAGMVLVTSALADYINISPLLTCMVFGAVFVNISNEGDAVIRISEMMTPPILMLFFVFSGASLDVSVIPQIGIVGAVYVVFRVLGKMFGSYISCAMVKAPKKVRKYLGFTLVPQAGVALGLMIVSGKLVPQYTAQITTVILCATLIYELVGSVLSKTALQRAGEIPAPGNAHSCEIPQK